MYIPFILQLCIFLVSSCLASEAPIRKEGYCSMYDNCGKKSVFGGPIPCPANKKAVAPSTEAKELLFQICGADFPIDNGVCCSYDQLVNLESNLKKAEPLISSCPACRKNFFDFFCKFTCSSDQSTFVEISDTTEAIDTKKEIVSELTIYTDSEYASDFFDSCKNIKFSASNSYAMDLIGGGAKNYSQFLKFLGDEKPLLGGSPFQINYAYELPGNDDTGLKLNSGDMKDCDDEVYKCACSDCPTSCPKLPKFKRYDRHCHVGLLPCFSFAVLIVWIIIIFIIGVYHIHIARQRRHQIEQWNRLIGGEEHHSCVHDDRPMVDTHISPRVKEESYFAHQWRSFRNFVVEGLEKVFAFIGYHCAKFPAITLSVCLLLVILLSSGLTQLTWETEPVKLWVSPNEPALKNLQYFEETFGEWFRIEQLFIASKDESNPVLTWKNVQWWFEKEQELYNLKGSNDDSLSIEDFCFKPLEDSCAIQSFSQYFGGDIRYLNENNWAKQLSSCAESPVECLPPFQQPLNKNLLFSSSDILESEAFVVTLLLESKSASASYTQKVTEYEHALQDWIKGLQSERPDLHISFSTESSLEEELNQSTNTDVKIVVISYLVMFLYASLALGGKIPTKFDRKTFVKTRFLLGLSGIIMILLSVTSAAGVFAVIGIKSTLIIAEVIPFLVLAVGVDNIFLIVHELHKLTEKIPEVDVETRISKALERIGPSCFISAGLQVSMFLLATSVQMPAVRNFAFYSAGAVGINFFLQMTAFIAVLSLDQHRLENGRVDCIPWVQLDNQIEIDQVSHPSDHIEYDFSHVISTRYAPWLLKPSNKRKVLSVFLIWLGISLSLLPGVELGLDQKIALPSSSYLVDYFESVYKYLNVGPPVFFVVKDLDVSHRKEQQAVCGKFSTCEEFSLANILEQEYKRSDISTIAEPASNWLDDFLNWLNPALDQCCRFKKSAFGEEFCSPKAPERQCEPCYSNHQPPYNSSMEGLPQGEEFMKFFKQWITEPSDPCPLGGKAPYSTSLKYNATNIEASYFRTSHTPMRSQKDFIVGFKNSLRVVHEIEKYLGETINVFAFSPFYVFFVQYRTIISLTFATLAAAGAIIWFVSLILLGSVRTATILVLTAAIMLANIGGVMALWSISLNAVSLVNLIICLGLAVEFTIHIARAYLKVGKDSDDEEDEELFDSFMNNGADYLQDERTSSAYKALSSVGGSVLGGITITKFIGIAVLAFTRSKIFEVYYFRMWLSLVVIAATHSLVLLPILLSMFGDV
ncbi:hypothetical protein FT663_04328 [Candidozyma haemuli var. vulneris]|nr:hypothetical protein FT662_04464 [[Candida] haemuloni var. vulneris]KAF3987761.1 hypothetical protein FT663_04328 [[Candida] haemuloni var. vulneris]